MSIGWKAPVYKIDKHPDMQFFLESAKLILKRNTCKLNETFLYK